MTHAERTDDTAQRPAADALKSRLREWLRHVPDRLLHASRRERAKARIRSYRFPRQVLYVCLANLCRSPYAEAASRRDAARWLAPQPIWRSAGLMGHDRPSPPIAIEVAGVRGAPLDAHRSHLVTSELIAASDVIVVMDPRQAHELVLRFGRRRGVLILGDFDPSPIDTRGIADPWNRTREDFVASYQRIDRCVASLLAALRVGTSL